MHPRPDHIAQGEKSGGDGYPMSFAGLEHRLCPSLVERDGRNNGAPFFTRNLGEHLSTDQLVLTRLEINSGGSSAEMASNRGHAFLDGTWENVGHDGLGAPALDPFFVENFLELLDGVLASQEGKEFVSELMESHSIPQKMSGANEQIELALLLMISERQRRRIGRIWGRGNGVVGGKDEIGNALV